MTNAMINTHDDEQVFPNGIEKLDSLWRLSAQDLRLMFYVAGIIRFEPYTFWGEKPKLF